VVKASTLICTIDTRNLKHIVSYASYRHDADAGLSDDFAVSIVLEIDRAIGADKKARFMSHRIHTDLDEGDESTGEAMGQAAEVQPCETSSKLTGVTSILEEWEPYSTFRLHASTLPLTSIHCLHDEK
jgi:hypothetical protein